MSGETTLKQASKQASKQSSKQASKGKVRSFLAAALGIKKRLSYGICVL